MGALIDAHGPDGHGGAGLGVDTRDIADGVFIDAADLRGRYWVVLRHQFGKILIAVSMGADISAIF